MQQIAVAVQIETAKSTSCYRYSTACANKHAASSPNRSAGFCAKNAGAEGKWRLCYDISQPVLGQALQISKSQIFNNTV
eukprot:IDg14454t1